MDLYHFWVKSDQRRLRINRRTDGAHLTLLLFLESLQTLYSSYKVCDLRYVDELGRKRGRLMGLGFAASHGGDALEFCAKVGFIKLLTKLWLNRL
jgi:hypothetical protein